MVRVRSFALSLGVCTLVISGLVTASHILIANSLDYASYWWMNRLTPHESDLPLNVLFFLLPLPAVLLGVIAVRRIAWFLSVALTCLAVYGSVRFLDEMSDLAISSVAVPSELYWLAPSIIYGIAAGAGAALGLLAAWGSGVRPDRRQRQGQ
jgi:hypothetical protein